jgi:hypothetical protein
MAEGVGQEPQSEVTIEERSFEELLKDVYALSEEAGGMDGQQRHQLAHSFCDIRGPGNFELVLLVTADASANYAELRASFTADRSKDLTPIYPTLARKLRELADHFERIEPSGPALIVAERTGATKPDPTKMS